MSDPAPPDIQVDPRTLGDLLPALLWSADSDGERVYFNSSWLRFRGRTLEQELGMGWAEGLHPDDAERYLAGYRDAIARHEPFELRARLRCHDGSYRWVLARGQPWSDGTRRGFLGASMDITDQVAGEVELRERGDALRLALSAAGMGTWIWRAGDDSVVWDTRLNEMFGLDGEFKGGFDDWLALVHPDDRAAVSEILDDAVQRQGAYEFEHRIVDASGAIRWIEARGEVFTDDDGGLGGTRGVAVDVTTRKWLDAALARASERLEVLAEAGRVLGSSLDLDETLRGLAQIVVARFAAGCEIDLVDGEHVRRFVAADAGPQAALRELESLPDIADHPIRRVLRSGHSEIIRFSESPDDFGPPDVPTSARALGVRAAVLVPIRVRGSVRGVLCLLWPDELDDLEARRSVADDLATRAGLAIDNARLFDRQRAASIQLQRALLPDDLTVPAGYRIAARYHPGSVGAEVGGDWYDAAVDAHGRLVLSVGDVVGKGVPAAAAMIKVRIALRSLMLTNPPAAAIAELSELHDVNQAGYVTVLVACIDRDGTATFASAGHPPPVVVSVDGSTRVLDLGVGCPLGFESRTTHVETIHRLAPGDRLVAYTDGLVERRDASIDAGVRDLAAIMAATAASPVDEMAERILSTMVTNRVDDDAAFVVLELPR